MYISKDCTWKVWTFWNNSINKKGTKVKLILSEISLNLYIYKTYSIIFYNNM